MSKVSDAQAGYATNLLEKAFQEVAKLPREDRESFAEWILDELADERHWKKSFAKSQNVLEKMAEKALANHADRKTTPLDPAKL